jgi:UDP-N-acetylmuramate: L-alanyl-gamma-D-glutamyl-meso-diaminopimelate ligase
MRVHVVGVSGTGMGSLAGLLVELGHEVTGSDVRFDPPIGPELSAWGVKCMPGYAGENLDPGLDLVVVGNVCRADNPEVLQAQALGLSVTHIAGALQRFVLEGASALVVAGTHGKTTTSSLCAWLLEGAGLEPGFLIGGVPSNFGRGFRRSRVPKRSLLQKPALRLPPFVLEGDEYDTAFFEKTAKFLHYRPEVAMLTSIEHDHVDIYATEAEYLKAFAAFIALVPEAGLIVAHAGDRAVVELVKRHASAKVGWYALEGEDTHGVHAAWVAAPATNEPQGQTFDLYAGGVLVGRSVLPLSGRHNLRNALAAVAAVSEGYGADLRQTAKRLASFQGVRRRQELLGQPGGVWLYDDFGHHPTAVRETLSALALRHPGARLICVFEPRSATACRKLHQDAYATSFDAASHVLLAPLGRSLPPADALDRNALARAVRERGVESECPESTAAIVERVQHLAKPGDVVLVLSNGAFDGIHQRLLAKLSDPQEP